MQSYLDSWGDKLRSSHWHVTYDHYVSVASGLMVRHSLPPAEQAWLRLSFTTSLIDLLIIVFTEDPPVGALFFSILFYCILSTHSLMHHFRKSNTLPWPSEGGAAVRSLPLWVYFSFCKCCTAASLHPPVKCFSTSNKRHKLSFRATFQIKHFFSCSSRLSSRESNLVQVLSWLTVPELYFCVINCIRTCWYLWTCRWLLTL